MYLCFDCDDTLYDLSWPFRKAVAIIFGSLDLDLDAFYKDYRDFGEAIFSLVQEGTISIDQSGEYRILKACEKYGIVCDEARAKAFQKSYKSYQAKISMKPCLHDYFSHTHSTLAVLTNGQDAHQKKKISILKMDQYTKLIFSSGELRAAKPDLKCFRRFVDKTKIPADSWIYIGDNYINDMQGAKNAGFKTIHFDRHHHGSGDAADHVVYSEEELVDLLQKLESEELSCGS